MIFKPRIPGRSKAAQQASSRRSESVLKEGISMYAIIETGGKQYKVEQGDVIYAELLNAQADDIVELKVIALGGDTLKTGKAAASAKVTAKVLKNGKGKKIRIFTYKPKKSSSRIKGHRQPYTKLEIVSIA